MEFHPLQSLIVIFLAISASHASRDPDTLIPKVIEDSLLNEGSGSFVVEKPKPDYKKYNNPATDQEIMAMRTIKLFILEKDMHPGNSVNLHISKDKTTTPPYVSQQVADSLPVATNKLQDIYKTFNIDPASIEGELFRTTCNKCEEAVKKGEDHYCATSFESMVDFASSKLGKRVKAVSTQVEGSEITPLQGYKVEEVKKLNGNNVVVCHQEYFAYAVHYCHKAPKINAYTVSLVGENNVKAKAIAVCHEDTASWNPKHLAFQVLNVKPGTDAVCHFLAEDDIAWVPY